MKAAEPPPAVFAQKGREAASTDALKSDAGAPEPFPADAQKREATQSAAGGAPPPAAKPAEARTDGLMAGKLATAPTPSTSDEGMREEQRANAPVAQHQAAPAPTRRLQEAEAPRAGASAGAPANAAADTTPVARAKVQPKLAVPDWIALIRKLRDEGKMDEAAKELAAFRAAYPDHERLLPADLRDWKPAPR